MSTRKKTKDEECKELINSLQLIEDAILSLPRLEPSWQTVANNLSKILFPYKKENGSIVYDALLKRVFPDIKLHPVKNKIKPKSSLMDQSWRISFSRNKVSFECFDKVNEPIPLEDWVEQIVLVTDGRDLTIRNVIKDARTEASHAGPDTNIRLDKFKSAFLLRIGEMEYPAHSITLAMIGAYLIEQVGDGGASKMKLDLR